MKPSGFPSAGRKKKNPLSIRGEEKGGGALAILERGGKKEEKGYRSV